MHNSGIPQRTRHWKYENEKFLASSGRTAAHLESFGCHAHVRASTGTARLGIAQARFARQALQHVVRCNDHLRPLNTPSVHCSPASMIHALTSYPATTHQNRDTCPSVSVHRDFCFCQSGGATEALFEVIVTFCWLVFTRKINNHDQCLQDESRISFCSRRKQTCGVLLALRRSVRPSMTWTWLGRTWGSHLASSSAHARRRLAGTTTSKGH